MRGAGTIGLAMIVIPIAAFFRTPLLPKIGDDLSMSAADLGAFTTIFAIGRLLVDIPAGRLADRIPPARMMAHSAFVVGLGSILLGMAPVSSVAYGAGFLLGIGSALTVTTGMTYFSSVASRERRDFLAALLHASESA